MLKRRKGWIVCFLAMTLCAGSALAQEATSKPSADVAGLIGQLGSDEFAARQSAQNKLVEMGPDVVPQLREAIGENISDEAKARLRAAITRIGENVILGPTFITMHYKEAPLQTVLDDFTRQAGAEMGVHAANIVDYAKTRMVDKIDLDHADFWSALSAVENASGLQTQPYTNNGGMMLELRPGVFLDFDLFQPAACTSGPVRVFPQSCQLNRVVQYGQGGARRQGNFVLMLAAVPEPKLHILGSVNGDWLRQCVDEHGQSLVVELAQQPSSFNGRQWWWQLQANLKDVPNMGHKIATLKGELRFRVSTKVDTMVVELAKAKNLRRQVGEDSVTVIDFKPDSGQFMMTVDINGPQPAGNPWARTTELANAISVLDEHDQPYQQFGGASIMQVGNDKMEIVLRFMPGQVMNGPGIGPPAKLRWDVATETREVTAPFELHNLDLPDAQ